MTDIASKPDWRRIAVVVVLVAALAFGLPPLVDWINPSAYLRPLGVHHYGWLSTYTVLYLGVVFAAVAGFRQGAGVLAELGLTPLQALPVAIGLAAVAAMAGVLAIARQPFAIGDLAPLIMLGIVSPVGEEILFRGFAFRQARRWGGLGFWPAAIPSSLLFGGAHVGQGGTPGDMALLGAITFAGGMLFCWVAERWQSLWPGIIVHAGFNGVWMVFSVGDNAIGSMAGNIARLAGVVVALGGTALLTRRRSG
jgi:membrane protease YdiL (CAAX protease family)